MNDLSNKNLEEILTMLPASLYYTKKKTTKMYHLRIVNLIGGGWAAYYKPSIGHKILSWGDVTSCTLRDCLVKCLMQMQQFKEKFGDAVVFEYDDIK